MVINTRRAAKLTAKGDRTRTRIISVAAQLIHNRGVARTTIEDVKTVAEVSGSQLYHYFADKDALLDAVIDHQADAVLHTQQNADLTSTDGLRAWRDLIIAEAGRVNGQGGCPLGALGGQLAETGPEVRVRVAAGFQRWTDAISNQLQTMHTNGELPPGTKPGDLAVTILAALQGGLLLAQIQRDTRPLETTLDTLIALTGPAPRQAAC